MNDPQSPGTTGSPGSTDHPYVVTPPASAPSAEQERALRKLTHVLYALYALFWLTGGVTAIVAIIINYIKRDDATGTLYASHFTWQIRTFWWSVAWGVLGVALAVVMVGFAILWVLGIWTLYRIVKGWLYLNDNKPMYAARA
ncbi:DUF4870 family protein [Pandoraea apista]|uniref:Membrane protein n=1 Tax=Pandoraea apista TaxID=93218 RepID=A0A5E5P8A0_9BURK|nr:hypothetical protein [Pandoraea apista]CFB61464.1 hypothetical protein LMG16407_01524 [Pandoraea apista]VVG72811.1 membrane protein [Pandoraea apista]